MSEISTTDFPAEVGLADSYYIDRPIPGGCEWLMRLEYYTSIHVLELCIYLIGKLNDMYMYITRLGRFNND